MPGERLIRKRLGEDLTNHQSKLVCLLLVTWAQFPRRQTDCGRRSFSQRPLLISAEDEPRQLPAARIRQRRNQPRSQIIRTNATPAVSR
jgi:hypothetical protein